jgi:hypothetical protein
LDPSKVRYLYLDSQSFFKEILSLKIISPLICFLKLLGVRMQKSGGEGGESSHRQNENLKILRNLNNFPRE